MLSEYGGDEILFQDFRHSVKTARQFGREKMMMIYFARETQNRASVSDMGELCLIR